MVGIVVPHISSRTLPEHVRLGEKGSVGRGTMKGRVLRKYDARAVFENIETGKRNCIVVLYGGVSVGGRSVMWCELSVWRWYCVVMWYCVVLYGNVWYCVVLYGIVW